MEDKLCQAFQLVCNIIIQQYGCFCRLTLNMHPHECSMLMSFIMLIIRKRVLFLSCASDGNKKHIENMRTNRGKS